MLVCGGVPLPALRLCAGVLERHKIRRMVAFAVVKIGLGRVDGVRRDGLRVQAEVVQHLGQGFGAAAVAPLAGYPARFRRHGSQVEV